MLVGDMPPGIARAAPTPLPAHRPELSGFHARLVELYGYRPTSLLAFLGTQNCGRAAVVSPLMPMVVRKNATCVYLKHRLEANSDEVQTARLCR